MGKLKSALWDWLEDYGRDLGYDWDNYPDISNWDNIRVNKITAKEYYETYQSRSNIKTRK